MKLTGKMVLAGLVVALLAVAGSDAAMARGGGGGGGGGKGGGKAGGANGNSGNGAKRVKRTDNSKKKDPKKLEGERERLRQLDFRDRDAGSDRGRA